MFASCNVIYMYLRYGSSAVGSIAVAAAALANEGGLGSLQIQIN